MFETIRITSRILSGARVQMLGVGMGAYINGHYMASGTSGGVGCGVGVGVGARVLYFSRVYNHCVIRTAN